jgi:hypothetical protein
MSRDALVVGISNYKNLPRLAAPAQDAEDMARCLESFGECRVVRLPEAIQNHKPVVSQQAGVTTQALESALIRLFKPAGKNIPHTAIFYFSGHGLQRNAGIQEGYLATSDIDPDKGNYGLSLYWLRRLLQESPVRQRVVILDCCNSGEFFNTLEADPGATSGTDRLFMAASREYEEAYESLTSSHSVFTQALLSALNPYKVKGGLVNGHHLIDAVNNQLKGELQQPLFESSGSEIVLTRSGGTVHQPEAADISAVDRLRQGIYKFCPFQGLAPFSAHHNDFFFGREELTQKLVDMAQTERLSMVTGPSGVGKTSLLRAGLEATLAQPNQCSSGIQWDVRYVSLSHDPLKQLAEAFVDPQVTGLQRAEQVRTAESFFHNQAQGITQLVQASLSHCPRDGAAEPHILLIIDQFEALFTPTQDAAVMAQRQAVMDGLLAAVHKTHVPMHIVLGMRSHHLEALNTYSQLKALVCPHCLWVPPMTYDQLKATIVGPLDKVGLQYDANLIYTLLLDVVGAPGELALLQMALKYLWRHREPQTGDHLPPRLTLEAYLQLGGIRHIVRKHATQVVESLSLAERAIAQRILLNLCEFGEGTTRSRRQVNQAELITPSLSEHQIAATANKLVAARLVVSHADYDCAASLVAVHQAVPAWSSEARPAQQPSSLSRLFQQHQDQDHHPALATPYFELCHDSLLRNWPLFDDWLQQHRPLMKCQRFLEAAAAEWQQQGQPVHPEYLLSHTRLAEALAFQKAHGDHLSVLAHRYLEVCRQQAHKLKRKRYLVRSLIPLSMAAGMVTAFGYHRITQVEPSGQHPATVVGQPQPVTTPRYLKASSDLGNAAAEGRPLPGQADPEQLLQASVLPGQMNHLPWQQREVAQPLEPQLSQVLKPAREVLPTWQQSLKPHRPVNPSPLAPFSQALPNPDGVEMLLQPVAQWVSSADPEVVVQVWCTRNAIEPVCFTSQVDLPVSAQPSIAPL